MKKSQPCIAYLITLLILFNFTSQEISAQDSKKKDRNMFGHYVQRGLTKTTQGLTPGYVLFIPPNSMSAYLINRKGEVVHEWKGTNEIHSPYLNDDGSLFTNALDLDFPVFAGGGESGRIQKISWDSKILWDLEFSNREYHAHHDIAVMPNGNILTIAWESKSYEEAIQAGRDPENTPKAGLWPDKIVELKPKGTYEAEIVWEWHVWDHLIQDFDPDKDNYGDVAAHPELLDLSKGKELPEPISQDSMDVLHKMKRAWRNRTVENRGSDVYHFNAINYNEELDQIAFSSPTLDEVFIIDHSTTTEEAAGHSGGKGGKGGDFLYRWGNPQNYKQGDSTNQKLFGQHDVRWIKKGFPGEGNLTLFNNDIPMGPDSLDYSAIYEIKPVMDEDGNYLLNENKRFGPKKPEWKYIAKDTISFYGSFVSGAERLKNGNTFINEGPRGRFFEVTPDGEIVWEYLNPYRGNIHHRDGTPVQPWFFTYSNFRANFIPAEHSAFQDKKLVPLDPQPEVFKLPPKKDKEEKE